MNTPSLRLRPLAAAILCSLLTPALFAQTATTTPVGFITRTLPAAFNSSTPSYTPFSVPLYQTAAFQSAVATTPLAGSHDITLSGAAFTLNQYSASPYLVRVKTGALVGKFWTVISHTADTLSLKEPLGGSPGVPDANLSGLVATDTCEILPANTFGSSLGTIAGLGTGSSASGATADNVLVWNGSSFDAYFYHTANLRWQKGISNATNTVIFPDDTLFFARKVESPLTLTFMGTVPSTTERTELTGSSYNFVANRFPTDTTLGATGLENTAGWVTGTSATGSDNVYLWNAANSQWDTYFYHSGNLRWQKGISNANLTSIPAATGYFVFRTPGTTDSILSQNLPYVP